MERVATGIRGFDSLVGGGIPKGSSILLSGPVGTERELFGLEYLYHGTENGEVGIYSSFEKGKKALVEMASVCDWKLEDAIKEQKLIVQSMELFNFEQYLASLEDTVFTNKATRLVVDSTSFLGQFFDSPIKLRTALNEMKKVLEKRGCTTLFISEGAELSKQGVEENLMDGAIQMHLIEKRGQFVKALSVRFMNSTTYSQQLHPIDLTKSGFKVHAIPLVL